MIFFIGDPHFGHANIIKYCSRPFASVEQMNHAIIANWEAIVHNTDTVYFLGDFCLSSTYVHLLSNLPFRHMFFIEGNHDPLPKLKALGDPRVEFHKHLEMQIDGRAFFLTHNPIQASATLPTICGHVHEQWTFLKKGDYFTEYNKAMVVKKRAPHPILNVSVDVHQFRPLLAEEVLKFFKGNPE